MGWGNGRVDVALLQLFEDDMASVACSRRYALPELEALALRAAQGGLLDAEDAGRIGQALREIREALDVIHKWLVLLRESRTGEVIVIELEEVGLLAEVPPQAGSAWLNGITRRFEQLHKRAPRRLVVVAGARLPETLRKALDGRLEIEEIQADERLRPGRARLVA